VKRTYYYRRGEREYGVGSPNNFDTVLATKGQQKAEQYRAGWNAKEESDKRLRELLYRALPEWKGKEPDAA
jgi:hypothetical protein